MSDFQIAVSADTVWREGGVRCVMVPSSLGTAVELRTDEGAVFLRKQAPSGTAAKNEAEPDAVLTKPCLLPTLLAASRLLLRRVLPAASRPLAAPTA